MFKPMVNKKGHVLCRCRLCGRVNYVEPHGTTARCSYHNEKGETSEHMPIPYGERDPSGMLFWNGGKVRAR
jgi:hypothetical protein